MQPPFPDISNEILIYSEEKLGKVEIGKLVIVFDSELVRSRCFESHVRQDPISCDSFGDIAEEQIDVAIIHHTIRCSLGAFTNLKSGDYREVTLLKKVITSGLLGKSYEIVLVIGENIRAYIKSQWIDLDTFLSCIPDDLVQLDRARGIVSI